MQRIKEIIYSTNNRKKWSSLKQRLRQGSTVWRSRETRISSCCRNKSICTCMISRESKEWWQLRRGQRVRKQMSSEESRTSLGRHKHFWVSQRRSSQVLLRPVTPLSLTNHWSRQCFREQGALLVATQENKISWWTCYCSVRALFRKRDSCPHRWVTVSKTLWVLRWDIPTRSNLCSTY